MRLSDTGLFILILDISLHSGYCNPRYSTAYLQDSCTCSAIDHLRCEPFTLDPLPQGAGNVALSRTSRFFKEFYCEFGIQAPSKNHRIMLTLNHINIPKTKGCKAGMLKIFDGPLGEKPPQLAGLCGAEELGFSFTSNTDRVTITYHQAISILKHDKSFNLTFTYFRVNDHGPTCNTSREFPCVNGVCVSRVLECDGWNNCGDNTDESMDYHVCGKLLTSSDPMVGLAVGVTVGSILIIIMAILIAYGVQRKKGPFFQDGLAMSTVHTSDMNGNTHAHIQGTSPPPYEEPQTSNPGSQGIVQNNIQNTLTNSEIHIHSNPMVHMDRPGHSHSVTPPHLCNMRLLSETPPPSYDSLFPGS